MIKKLTAAIMFASAANLLASGASATTQDINLSATVTGFCRIAGSLTPTADSVTIPIDYTTGADVDTTQILRVFAVVCNKATNISLTSINGGLIGPTAATGFEHIINYTAELSGFVTLAAGSTATTGTASVGANESLGSTTRATPGAASVTMTITPLANTDPLAAGSYADTLRLIIAPQ
jgi:hypothetical protein